MVFTATSLEGWTGRTIWKSGNVRGSLSGRGRDDPVLRAEACWGALAATTWAPSPSQPVGRGTYEAGSGRLSTPSGWEEVGRFTHICSRGPDFKLQEPGVCVLPPKTELKLMSPVGKNNISKCVN